MVDGQAQPLPALSVQPSIQPSISTSSHQEDSSSSDDQMDDVTSNDFPLAPTTTMNPQLLNDLGQAINATQGLSVPEQLQP